MIETSSGKANGTRAFRQNKAALIEIFSLQTIFFLGCKSKLIVGVHYAQIPAGGNCFS
jgi:hypothetical protein